jgi:replicative DNA helicase
MSNYEKALIGCILIDSNASLYACKERRITGDSFSDPDLCKMFCAIDHMAKSSKAIDVLTVSDKAGIDIGVLDGIMRDTPTAAHVGHYAEEVKTAEQARELARMLDRAQLDIKQGVSVPQLVKTLQAGLIEVSDNNAVKVKKLSDLREQKIEQWKAAQEHGFIGVPFTLPTVNRSLGGWRPKCVGIIAGYRGEGKSTLMRQQCLELAKAGKGVALFTLEDPDDIAGASMVGAHAEISVFGLDTGRCAPDKLNQIDQAWRQVGDIPLFIMSGSLGVDEIDTTAQMLKMKHDIDIVFVDHVQYIAPLIMRGMSRNDTMAYYSQRFSAMSKKLDIPVVLASQLSRDSEKQGRKPKLSDLRDSGTLEQDARQILLLYFDGEKDNHIIELAKNNFGESRKEVDVKRLDGRQKFEEV